MNDVEPGLDSSSRLKRPTPQRQAPLRRPPLGLPASMGATLNGALGAAIDTSQTISAGLGAAVRQGLDSGQAMSEAAGAGVQGFVERGVNTAYQVIEEYMQRGQEAAQRLSPAGPGPARPGLAADAANAWAQNLAGPLGQTASSLAAPWMQLVRAWVDGVGTLAPMAGQLAGRMAAPMGDLNRAGVFTGMGRPSAAAPGTEPMGAQHPAAGHAATGPAVEPPLAAAPVVGPRAKTTIEFMSGQPAEFSVSLDPGADLAALKARWSGETAVAAAPAQVTLYCVPGHVHVRLSLAESPPAGRHEAALIDGYGQSWGNLTMAIAERAADTPAA
jgi:hypothetical protein